MPRTGQPRFSVIIPTRNRHSTLSATIQTCLAQSFEDFEVVVVDNASTPETQAVVAGFSGDERVRYVRFDTLAAMSRNWERSLLEAHGEFVTVLGSDDGFLPSAFGSLDQLLRESGTEVVRWDCAMYFWPAVDDPRVNTLQFGVPRGVEWVDSAQLVRQVSQFDRHYAFLPMLYNSFVKRSLLSRIVDGCRRPFLCGTAPDIVSGFRVAMNCTRFLNVSRVMAIAGLSSSSNGLSTLREGEPNLVAKEFERLNEEEHISLAEGLPLLSNCIPVLVADGFRQVSADTPGWAGRADTTEPSRFLAVIIESLSETPGLTEQIWESRLNQLKNHFRLDQLSIPFPANGVQRPPIGFQRHWFCLDTCSFAITDISLATSFLQNLLGPMPFEAPASRALEVSSITAQRRRIKNGMIDLLPPVLVRWLKRLRAPRR